MPPFPRLSSPAILSPMAGVTDVAFRALCKAAGAGLTCTEFLSSAAIVRANPRTEAMLVTDPIERPVAIQLFGNSIEEVVAAAQLIEHGFDVIDVNCGCPAWKVVRTGAGSALLKDPAKIASFVSRLAGAVSKPVTVKIRIGLDDQHINAVEVAKAVEDAGAAAIAVHGRTQAQGYSGAARWDIIKEVKESVSIPVIGNGDVFTAEQFAQRLESSGVDAILVARGAVGNPFLFSQIEQLLHGRIPEPVDRWSVLPAYLELANRYQLPFAQVKSQAVSFARAAPGAKALRERLMACATREELEATTETIGALTTEGL